MTQFVFGNETAYDTNGLRDLIEGCLTLCENKRNAKDINTVTVRYWNTGRNKVKVASNWRNPTVLEIKLPRPHKLVDGGLQALAQATQPHLPASIISEMIERIVTRFSWWNERKSKIDTANAAYKSSRIAIHSRAQDRKEAQKVILRQKILKKRKLLNDASASRKKCERRLAALIADEEKYRAACEKLESEMAVE